MHALSKVSSAFEDKDIVFLLFVVRELLYYMSTFIYLFCPSPINF